MSCEQYKIEVTFQSTTAPKGIIGNSEVTQTAHACGFDMYIKVRDMLRDALEIESPNDQMKIIDPKNLGEEDTRSSMEVMLVIDLLEKKRAHMIRKLIEYNVPSYYKYSIVLVLG